MVQESMPADQKEDPFDIFAPKETRLPWTFGEPGAAAAQSSITPSGGAGVQAFLVTTQSRRVEELRGKGFVQNLFQVFGPFVDNNPMSARVRLNYALFRAATLLRRTLRFFLEPPESRRRGALLNRLTFSYLRLCVIAPLLICVLPIAVGSAADSDPSPAKPVDELSLEDLVNIKVTSVTKRETSLEDSPAAVTVVTQDDIRRFGITSIPDALRLVPGMDVAQVNSHEWAVSVRGFNGEFANKLLVMVDGRSVYTTAFGGVVWGMQDVVMEDLDRIEVIRGPGGSLWGANAVNGVINIITKSAKDTQGGLISTTVGTEDQPSTTIQYGGQLATNLYYRAYVKYFNRDEFVDSTGGEAPDPWSGIQGGFRLDWEPSGEDKLTLQGDYYEHRVNESQNFPSLFPPYLHNGEVVNHDSGGNVLGRWSHDISDTSALTAQAYFDHFRPEQLGVRYSADTFDLDVQHSFALGSRNDILWGLGYRHISDKIQPSSYLSFNPESQDQQLFSSFVQDEATLIRERLKLTFGSKFEHNDFTGLEIEPSGRLLWTPTEEQAVWASVSRAVRTPSRAELSEEVSLGIIPPTSTTPPILLSTFGNPNLQSEQLVAYELGYRLELGKRLSWDLAAFYNEYNDLILPVAGAPEFEMTPFPPHLVVPTSNQDAGGGHTYGAEVSARWKVTDVWHLIGSYSWLEAHFDSVSSILQGSPQQQFQLRSILNLPANIELSGAAFYVDQIEAPYGTGLARIPAYVRLDVGAVWHATKSLELGVWGQNLIDDRHLEFPSEKSSLLTEVPRGFVARLTLRF
jgi:iron complex outermembrane receptor protein